MPDPLTFSATGPHAVADRTNHLILDDAGDLGELASVATPSARLGTPEALAGVGVVLAFLLTPALGPLILFPAFGVLAITLILRARANRMLVGADPTGLHLGNLTIPWTEVSTVTQEVVRSTSNRWGRETKNAHQAVVLTSPDGSRFALFVPSPAGAARISAHLASFLQATAVASSLKKSSSPG